MSSAWNGMFCDTDNSVFSKYRIHVLLYTFNEEKVTYRDCDIYINLQL